MVRGELGNARRRERWLSASWVNPCAGLARSGLSGSPSRTRTYNKPVNSQSDAEHKDNQDNTYGESSDGVALGVAQIPTDPDLARVVEAWPDLPEAIRRAVVALVATAAAPGNT